MDDRRKKQAFRLALPSCDEIGGATGWPRADARSQDFDADIAQGFAHRITLILRDYLETQRGTFPYAHIERIVTSLVVSRTRQGDVEDMPEELDAVLIEWLEGQRALVEGPLSKGLSTAAAAGFIVAFNGWMERFGLDLTPTPDMTAGLNSWGKRQATTILSLIDDTTRKGISEVIGKALKESDSVDQIMRAVRAYLDTHMAPGRAELIADVETYNALHQGALDANKVLGAKEKRWVTEEDRRVCIICFENSAQGSIQIGRTFLSGDFCPPAHPHCRCSLAFSGITRESVLAALGDVR